ncbi:MAG: hypothetical protein RBS25_03665 [Bacilli bacterium]|jgi:hypothetical protein|nr:hypothetical protein [Bacilli bacterium]
MLKEKLNKLMENLVDLMGLDPIGFRFEDLKKEDSRLYIKEGVIAINETYKENELEAAKCLIHEVRHVFQLYYIYFRQDELAALWRKEIQNPFQLTDCQDEAQLQEYLGQHTEMDAFAFTQLYVKHYYKKEIKHPLKPYQEILDQYKESLIALYPELV